MALTPAPIVLGLVRKAELLRLQLAEQVPLLHPQGHQPPLVKRHLMTSDTRTPAGQQSRLFSTAAAPFGQKTGASWGILDWVGDWPGSGGRMTDHLHISLPCTVFCSDWVIFFLDFLGFFSFFSNDCPTNATHDLPTTRQRNDIDDMSEDTGAENRGGLA